MTSLLEEEEERKAGRHRDKALAEEPKIHSSSTARPGASTQATSHGNALETVQGIKKVLLPLQEASNADGEIDLRWWERFCLPGTRIEVI